MPFRRHLPLAVPWLVLALALAPALYAWHRAARTAAARDRERFAAEVEAAWTALSRSTLGYVNALRATQAMLHATGETSPEAWRRLLAGLEWRKRFPGFLDIGFAEGEDGRVRYVDAVAGAPAHAGGSSLAEVPAQRAAMAQARDTRVLVSTGEVAGSATPCILVFIPVWRDGEKPASAAAARADLRGFVFASFAPGALYQERAEASPARMLTVEYLGPAHAPPPSSGRPFDRLLPVPGLGRDWLFRCTPGPGFAAAQEQSLSILLGGGAIALLLFGIAWQQMRRRLLVERVVAERTGELVRAERELRAALAHERELHELKTNFVNLVSHEFRTPLGIILASAGILEKYLDRLAPEERDEHLRDIAGSTRHMAGLMEEVLLLGRVEAGRLECAPAPLDLASFCAELADELRSSTDGVCPIELQTSGLEAPARADAGLLRHIFTNLLSNAVKYSPPGSPVSFRARRESTDAHFEISDRGIGIPADELPHLFTAFRRAKNVGTISGSGLGLVIVKRCVEVHGGEISLEKNPGPGIAARVRLPLFPA